MEEPLTLVMHRTEAEAMLTHRVCGECHGQLTMVADHYEAEKYHVFCSACSPSWRGSTISTLTLERRHAWEREQYQEARINLRDILPQKSDQQLLEELGL